MRFFPIVPIKYLTKLAGLSSNQMILAHWLTDKRYLNFYKKRKAKGDFIILDNGACELGASIPIEELMTWYENLGGVDVLVLPDSNTDNLKVLIESVDWLARNIPYLFQETRLMMVPHTLEELDYIAKIETYSLWNYPIYIGLNRDFEDYDYGTGGRAGVIEQYKNCGKKFHLLGIRRNPIEEIIAVKQFGDLVLGIDSSFPYRLFSRGRRLDEHRPYPEHDSMYQDTLSDEILKFCVGEFRGFLEWME